MDISKISDNGIKIKSKLALLGINTLNTRGIIALDAVLLFDKIITKKQLSFDGQPLIINGQGEYEIKGMKLNGESRNNGIFYKGKIDNMYFCIYRSSIIKTTKDAIEECEIAIIDSDIPIDQKIIAAMNVKVAILYGIYAEAGVKAFGKEVVLVAKYSITRDKLPAEMEIVLLS